MAYDKFNILNSSAVPLNIDNVDTDQIIPARFLKATERKGFGENLFKEFIEFIKKKIENVEIIEATYLTRSWTVRKK